MRYANVTSTLALVLAMSGGAYAVTTAPKDSVVSSSVLNGSLSGVDVKNESLTTSDLSKTSRVGATFRFKDNQTLAAGAAATLVTAPAEPGAYVVTGEVTVANASNTRLDCTVFRGEDVELASGVRTIRTAAETLTITGVTIAGSTTQLRLFCQNTEGGMAFVPFSRLTLLKVPSLGIAEG